MNVLQIAVAIFTVGLGIFTVLKPETAARFTGFGNEVSPRGLSEIRSVLGGAFIGAGAAALLLSGGRQALALVYLGIGAVRLISILQLDKDKSPSSLISVISEFLFVVILLLPL